MAEVRKKVILLRSPESSGKDPYHEVLKKAGFEVVSVPTLAFQYHNLNVLKSHFENPSKFSGVIFTSPRSVHAAREALGGCVDEAWSSLPCFVVGERTACLVEEHLGLQTDGSDSGNAENLADQIIAKINDLDKPLLFPCGSFKREILPMKLQEKGIQVVCCIVYDTCKHPDLENLLRKVLLSRPDFILYFSPSGVKFSLQTLKETDGFDQVKLIAIGPATKEALEKADLEVFGTAAKPSPESVLDTIQD